MLKTIAKTIIKSILWIIDKDHRCKEEIAMDNVKKFTHIIDVNFQSDFGKASKVFRTVPYSVWKLKTETKELIAADKHRVIRDDGSCVWLEDLVAGDLIKTDSGIEKVIECRNLNIRTHMYCLQIDTDDHLYYTDGILSHNTTCAAGFLLWKAMFTPDSTILVVANMYAQALEIMDRIRYAYENVPNHIRAGVNEYNKGSISFDNGSRIISRATSPHAARGLSISLLYCDEFSYVPPSKQKDFVSSVLPVLSTGGSAIITSTPRVDEDEFAQIWKGAIDNTDEFGNPREDKLGRNGWYAFSAIWSEHPDRDEKWADTMRQSLGRARFQQEFCNQFYSDEETLIHPQCLKRLTDHAIDPLFYIGTTRWYAEPKSNKGYLVSLDPATGTGSDFSAIQVFQLGAEIVQIAEWSHNHTPARGQVKMLLQTLLFLDQALRDIPDQMGEPEIYWSFENNGVGAAIAQVIDHTGEDRFPGYLMSDRRKGSKALKGMFTSRTKSSECARFKSLLESDRMKINSKNLVKELKYYIATENSFKAKIGEHDDLVSASLLAVKMLDLVMRWEGRTHNELREYIEDDEIMQVDPMPVVV